MKKELFRLYKLVKRNGFTSKFATMQAKSWINGISDTNNIILYHQKPTNKSKSLGNS